MAYFAAFAGDDPGMFDQRIEESQEILATVAEQRAQVAAAIAAAQAARARAQEARARATEAAVAAVDARARPFLAATEGGAVRPAGAAPAGRS